MNPRFGFILLGVVVLVVAISIGFIRVDDATYMQWRFIFAAGEGIAIALGVVSIIAGAVEWN